MRRYATLSSSQSSTSQFSLASSPSTVRYSVSLSIFTVELNHCDMAPASSRAPVAFQSGHILASDPSTHFYLATHHGAPDDNLSLAHTLYEDPWTIKKVLTTSDVDGSCRLLLSTNAAYEHFFSSTSKNDALCRTSRSKGLKVWHADESCGNNLFFKNWDNTDCFVVDGKWKGNFVNSKSLKEGDIIGLAWHGA
ncbi:hypothetical protein LguiB_024596 [Lonicera macranthoides]